MADKRGEIRGEFLEEDLGGGGGGILVGFGGNGGCLTGEPPDSVDGYEGRRFGGSGGLSRFR